MLAGIVFQLGESLQSSLPIYLTNANNHPAGIIVYLTCATEFIVRYLYDRPVREIPDVRLRDLHYLSYDYKLMLVGLMFSTVCIFIRCVLFSISFQSDRLLCSLFQIRLPYL